jgi:hypothetical protein
MWEILEGNHILRRTQPSDTDTRAFVSERRRHTQQISSDQSVTASNDPYQVAEIEFSFHISGQWTARERSAVLEQLLAPEPIARVLVILCVSRARFRRKGYGDATPHQAEGKSP